MIHTLLILLAAVYLAGSLFANALSTRVIWELRGFKPWARATWAFFSGPAVWLVLLLVSLVGLGFFVRHKIKTNGQAGQTSAR